MASAQRDPLMEARLREMVRLISAQMHDFPLTTELYADLSISGDDAAELLGMISNEFGTSFLGMGFSSYFPNETDAFWYHWWYKLSRQRPKYKSFTFGHLVMVVEQGSWFEPEPPQKAP